MVFCQFEAHAWTLLFVVRRHQLYICLQRISTLPHGWPVVKIWCDKSKDVWTGWEVIVAMHGITNCLMTYGGNQASWSGNAQLGVTLSSWKLACKDVAHLERNPALNLDSRESSRHDFASGTWCCMWIAADWDALLQKRAMSTSS